jgi:6-phosphogluconolactonase
MSGANANRVHVVVADDLAGVARHAANLFVRLARQAEQRGMFSVALSGGSTPKALHELLTEPPYREQVDWAHVRFYWGDDRYVAPDDPESNFRMARESLLDQLPLREAQIHRIHTEMNDPAAAAALYEDELRREFGLREGQVPRFDLILLGMGPDGHTASLFPHTAALAVTDRLVVANSVPKLATWRITFTVPVINTAANVAFLVAGHDKADALAHVLDGPRDPEEYPSQLVAPRDGDLDWYVDRAAAAQLKRAASGDGE